MSGAGLRMQSESSSGIHADVEYAVLTASVDEVWATWQLDATNASFLPEVTTVQLPTFGFAADTDGMIEKLDTVTGGAEAIEERDVWLLKQKQTQDSKPPSLERRWAGSMDTVIAQLAAVGAQSARRGASARTGDGDDKLSGGLDDAVDCYWRKAVIANRELLAAQRKTAQLTRTLNATAVELAQAKSENERLRLQKQFIDESNAFVRSLSTAPNLMGD
jgi:hypothetical protein